MSLRFKYGIIWGLQFANESLHIPMLKMLNLLSKYKIKLMRKKGTFTDYRKAEVLYKENDSLKHGTIKVKILNKMLLEKHQFLCKM